MTSLNGRRILLSGAVLAGISVALGAFGSHALESLVTPERIGTWETGVRYQMLHALALLILGTLVATRTISVANFAAWCFTLGTVLFSGSLYLLVLLNQPILGAITPLGGVLYLLGWAALISILWRWQPK